MLSSTNRVSSVQKKVIGKREQTIGLEVKCPKLNLRSA